MNRIDQVRWRPARLTLHSRLGLLVGLALVVAACAPPNERVDIAGDLADAVATAGDDGVVDIGSIAPFAWETMYAFPGGTPDRHVNEVIGQDWATGEGNSTVPADGLVLVIFVQGADVIAWTVLNRGDGPVAVRFESSLYSTAIPKTDAAFRADLREPTISGHDLYLLSSQ